MAEQNRSADPAAESHCGLGFVFPGFDPSTNQTGVMPAHPFGAHSSNVRLQSLDLWGMSVFLIVLQPWMGHFSLSLFICKMVEPYVLPIPSHKLRSFPRCDGDKPTEEIMLLKLKCVLSILTIG